MPFGQEETRPIAHRYGRNGDGTSGVVGAVLNVDGSRLANLLGWFSIGLGLAAALSPRSTARLVGADDDASSRTALQLVGVRELVSGIGILTNPAAPGWLWSRAAGDVMDLALLGTALASDRGDAGRLTASTAAVAGIALLDLFCAERLSNRGSQNLSSGHSGQGHGPLARAASAVAAWTGKRPLHVACAITVKASPEELYRFWRNVENLPRIMYYLESVRPLDDRRSHWQAKGPLGSRIEWESEITEDAPGERIGWRSRRGAAVDNRGVVTFESAPGNRGTIVKVELDYRPPGGSVGAAFAKLLGRSPEQEAAEDLRRFKQIIETGEVLESDATVKGAGAARPVEQVPDRARGRSSHGADPVISSASVSTSSAQGSPV